MAKDSYNDTDIPHKGGAHRKEFRRCCYCVVSPYLRSVF